MPSGDAARPGVGDATLRQEVTEVRGPAAAAVRAGPAGRAGPRGRATAAQRCRGSGEGAARSPGGRGLPEPRPDGEAARGGQALSGAGREFLSARAALL